eukprot:UN04662
MLDVFEDQYKNILFITVDYDEFPDLVEEYLIEKLPTSKFFVNGEVMNTIQGLGRDKANTDPNAKGSYDFALDVLSDLGPKQPIVRPGVPAPALVEQDDNNNHEIVATEAAQQPEQIQKVPYNPQIPNQQYLESKGAITRGSSKLSIPPQPQELKDFLNSLTVPHTIVLFTTNGLNQADLPQTLDFFNNKPLDILKQTVKDIETLVERFSDPQSCPIDFKHIVVDESDKASMVLAEEYNCTTRNMPVIKLMWKKTVFHTSTKGDTLDVESNMVNFVQL